MTVEVGKKDEVLHMLVAQKIKDMIVHRQMQPGDRLPTEQQLMETFEISRSTLRESMKVLKAENVIVTRQGSGTFISSETGIAEDPLGLKFVNPDTLLENLFETRILLEPRIAGFAAQRAEKCDIERLEQIVNMLNSFERNDASMQEMDIRFHTAIARCTHNDVLIRVVPIIIESIKHGHVRTADDRDSFIRAKRSHNGIYRAIADNDVMEAVYLMERHIRETRNDILSEESL